MSKKISKIFGVVLTLMVLASLMAVATPASAGTLSISAESDVPKTEGNILAPVGTDILDLAVNGNTIYAATTDTASAGILYKSTDGGNTWKSLETSTDWSAADVLQVAVAQDDPNVVVTIQENFHVLYSSNGGNSWSNMGLPTGATALYDIDVSTGTTHYVAAGGTNATGADMWTIKLDIAQSFIAQNGATGFKTAEAYVKAVKFSPNFPTDKIVTAISGNTTDAYFQVFRLEVGQYKWNGSIPFYALADWGTGYSLATIAGGLSAASITLDGGYLGTDPQTRVAFVGIAAGGSTTADGVIRVVDTYQKTFSTWSAGDEGGVGSVAYKTGGKLIAGSFGTNTVYVDTDPLASTPMFDRVTTLKQPGGTGPTQVAWSGTNAVAGTAGDESAFAVSADSGYSFNDVSLIDTVLSILDDVAVNAAGNKIYMTSHNGTATSVWLKQSGVAWMRTLSYVAADTDKASFLVRIAPENDAAVYLASKTSATADMWASKDSGLNNWKSIPAYKLATVVDFIVKDANTVYAVDSTQFSQTTNAGVSWATAVSLDGLTATNISLAPNGNIFVGGTSYFSFSKDAGATFDRSVTSPASGNVYIIPTNDYATSNYIYAAVGKSTASTVKRGQAIKTSQTWSTRAPTIPVGQVIVGAGVFSNVPYILTGNATDGAFYRALNLTKDVSEGLELWSSMTTTQGLQAAPQALRFSNGPKLWYISTESKALYSTVDPIATAGPTQTSPADKFLVTLNATKGDAYNVTFIWSRYATDKITQMQLQVAVDSTFNGVIYDYTFADVTTDSIARVVGPSMNSPNTANFNPGGTYYWRVRVGQTGPLYSPWSTTRSFTIAPPIDFNLVAPTVGATGISSAPTFSWTAFQGAIGYEIAVSTDPTFAILDYSHTTTATFYKPEETLKYDTTYYWRVRGVTGAAPEGKAAPGGAWVNGIFTTGSAPVAPTPPVIIQQPTVPEIKIIEVPVEKPAPIPDYLLWAIISIGAILIIALIVLIVRTRRVA